MLTTITCNRFQSPLACFRNFLQIVTGDDFVVQVAIPYKNKRSKKKKFQSTRDLVKFHQNFTFYYSFSKKCLLSVAVAGLKLYLFVLNFDEKIGIRNFLPKNFEIISTPFKRLLEVSKSMGPKVFIF